MLVPKEQIRKRIVDGIVVVLVPHVMEEIVEVVKHLLQERVPSHKVEQIIDALMPRVQEEPNCLRWSGRFHNNGSHCEE